jgi:hypothetical protein
VLAGASLGHPFFSGAAVAPRRLGREERSSGRGATRESVLPDPFTRHNDANFSPPDGAGADSVGYFASTSTCVPDQDQDDPFEWNEDAWEGEDESAYASYASEFAAEDAPVGSRKQKSRRSLMPCCF